MILQPRRGGIFGATDADDAAPTGLEVLFGWEFYKDVAPTVLAHARKILEWRCVIPRLKARPSKAQGQALGGRVPVFVQPGQGGTAVRFALSGLENLSGRETQGFALGCRMSPLRGWKNPAASPVGRDSVEHHFERSEAKEK